MVRQLQFVLALGIAGLIGAAMLSGRMAIKPENESSGIPPPSTAETAAEFDTPTKSKQAATETVNSRNVGAGVVATPLLQQGPLERVASLPQPTPPAEPNAGPTIPDRQFLRWRLVFNAVATSAGILQSGDTALVLPGIDVVSADETCTTPTGGSWPCGMVARTAFRNYLQGRALNCHLPDSTQAKAIVAECLLQGQDPAIWLVERGWARPNPDSPHGALAEYAKAASRGIYGQPPAGVEVKTP